ncbi:unnamed protein product [Durusdinium trenchii]|uniref:3'-5' exonuclease domain-containing protein n=1 Tax=Durusdinium trenchii TaxID=1381693 RepID=A0ABP0SKD8_9DINO
MHRCARPSLLVRPTCALESLRCPGFAASTRWYRRHLWKSEFPSDLPPALRQHAAIIRHAAPEVSPHKAVFTIHASQRIWEIAIDLCARRAINDLAANIIYRALAALDCTDWQEYIRRQEDFRQDLFTACSNLFEVHHVHEGAECIFGVLNESTLRSISPVMKTSKRQLLKNWVVDIIEEWVLLHQESFSRISATKLLEVVGPAAFVQLIPRLGIGVHALQPDDLEVLFHHLTEDCRDMFGAIRIGLSFLPLESLMEPLGGSGWSLRRVLKMIEERRSEHGLRFFLAHLPVELLMQALSVLRERDLDTGLSRNPWSFSASLCIEADFRTGRPMLPNLPAVWPMHAPSMQARPALAPIDEDEEVPKRQRMWLTDGEFMPIWMTRRRPKPLAGLAPPSRLRDSSWPQLAFDPHLALAEDREERGCRSVDAYQVLAQAEASNDVALWEPSSMEESNLLRQAEALPSPSATLPLDAIHFVDSAQGLSHVLTFFQQAAPEYIGIDLEWSDPQPVSIIQIATPSRAFVLDCVNRTPLYMAVLHCLVEYLLKRESITKLFFGFPHDLIRLNMLFGPFGRTFGSRDYLASVLDLYMQRVRRIDVKKPRAEDTPLGREMLMGEALKADDLEKIGRLGEDPLPPYPLEEHSEQVFTVGGHQSLSRLVNTYLGESLSKQYRVSNWNFRPLSTVQVIYAATDAHVLLRLEAAMRKQQVLPQRTWGVAYRDKHQPAWWRSEPDSSSHAKEILSCPRFIVLSVDFR